MIGTSDTFGPYGPEHGLCVVDMQREFLTHDSAWIRRLRQNICRHVYDCLSQKGTVIIVEFEGFGETLPEIIQSAEEGYKAGHVGKRSPGQGYLFFSRRSNANLIEANMNAREYFQNISKTKKWTLGGVSTPACVTANAHGLKGLGLDVRIRAGLTVNPNSIERNQLSKYTDGIIKEGILFFPECKMPTKDSLIDYLYTS